jgi:organic radical activating enzyme
VITGGEPAMYNLNELTNALHEAGLKTNIETSGAHPLTGNWDWVCFSPKKFKAPVESIFKQANELKIIIFNNSDFEWAEDFAKKVSPECELFLQPEWSKEKEMVPKIIEYVKTNPKWKVSLQIHKYMNIP